MPARDLTNVEIKLGADPEFLITDADNRNCIGADEILGGDSDRCDSCDLDVDERDCDDCDRDSGEDVYSAALGCDGCSSTGEMRPGPGNPDQVIANIDNIITEAWEKFGKDRHYHMVAGAYPHQTPTGGHIHFSGVDVNSAILRVLDKFISMPLREISDEGRTRTGYGALTEYRNQVHGWEYRSPCSWISHPKIAKGVLTISYIIAKEHKAGRLEALNEMQDIVNAATEAEKVSLNEYFDVVAKMKEGNIKLEDVEIFQAWKKKTKEPVPTPEVPIEIDLSYKKGDFNLKKIVVKEKINNPNNALKFEVIGYKDERLSRSGSISDFKGIFLPNRIISMLGDDRQTIHGVHIYERRGEQIAMTHALREDVELSKQVIGRIKFLIQRHLQHNAKKDFMKVIEGV